MGSYQLKYHVGDWVYAKEKYTGKAQIVEINLMIAASDEPGKVDTDAFYLVEHEEGTIFELDEREITGTYTPSIRSVAIRVSSNHDSVFIGNSVDELLDSLNIYTDLYRVFGDEEYGTKVKEIKALLTRKAQL